MPDQSNPFQQLVRSRSQSDLEKVEMTPQPEAKVRGKEDRALDEQSNKAPALTSRDVSEEDKPRRGRGRPATGKRSNPDWLGRTYYVRQETDLDVEEELLNLKRQGIEIDKSELVDGLLVAWVKWRNGEQANILLGKISPRRK